MQIRQRYRSRMGTLVILGPRGRPRIFGVVPKTEGGEDGSPIGPFDWAGAQRVLENCLAGSFIYRLGKKMRRKPLKVRR